MIAALGKDRKSGFTLVELLVVIAILALLLAFILPALNRARRQTYRVICSTHMKDLGRAIVMFADDNNGMVPPLRLIGDRFDQMQTYNHWARWWHWASDDSYWNLGFLWKENLIKDGEVFYCPSREAVFRYEDYANPVFPTDIQPSPGASTGVRVPYSYNPMCVSTTDPDKRRRLFMKISQFNADNSLILVDVLRPGSVAHINGWNISLGDMSVNFVMNDDVLEVMDASGNDFIEQDYASWDTVMDMLRGVPTLSSY